MKFHILIYGCQMNYADSARIKAVLLNCGFEYSEKIEDADIIIFDTCSVRQKSEDKITGLLKDIPKDKKIWITGCMIQHQLRIDRLGIDSPYKRGNFIGVAKSSPLILGLETSDRGVRGVKRYIPYNPDLTEKAKYLRNNMTKAEIKIWNNFLKIQDYKFLRQKPIDEYIVDFYCSKLGLIIEIDGDTHWSDKEIAYDKKRTRILESYGLKVLRFTNTEIYNDFEEVCLSVKKKIDSINPPNPPVRSLETKYQGGEKGPPYQGGVFPLNEDFNPLSSKLKRTFPNLELFFRIDDVGFLPAILPEFGYEINSDIEIYNEYEKIIPEGINTSMNKHNKTAYIPISTGCNQFCSYCIVPYARGLERNFDIEHIIDECKIHLKNGAKEIVLLGQIVNKHPDFVEILEKVLKLEGLKWLRYTSPYPTFYSKELLELHEKEEKLCPHIHIPFQSGSDKILKSMFRGYSAKQCYGFIDKIRRLKRDISITTDIIVGFSGETEEDSQESLKLIEYGKFNMVYIGIYSLRPGTHAAKNLEDNITAKMKHQRRDELNNLLNKISLENNEGEVGKTKAVIINDIIGQSKDGFYKYSGYTDNMKQIIIKSKKELEMGSFMEVKITKGVVFKLYGEV